MSLVDMSNGVQGGCVQGAGKMIPIKWVRDAYVSLDTMC